MWVGSVPCQWQPSPEGPALEPKGDRLDLKGAVKDGQFLDGQRSWTLKCGAKVVALTSTGSARLVIFFGSNFSRYILYRGAEVVRASVNVFKVQELGRLRLSLRDAPREVPVTQGAYLASPLQVDVSAGRCKVAMRTGDAVSIDGLRLGVVVCEKRTQVEDPHVEPSMCILDADAEAP